MRFWYAWSRGLPPDWLKQVNVDAMSTWIFHGLRVDGLQRALWYVPQHSMAGALGLLALAVASVTGVGAGRGAIALAGVALGAATAFNPFVGGVFSMGYGLAMALDVAVRRQSPLRLWRPALAAVPVALALGWIRVNGMLGTAVGQLHFGYTGPATQAPVVSLALSLGLVLVPAVLGLWPRRGLPVGRVAPAAFTAALGLFFAYTLVLTVDLFWVGFRGTQVALAVVPALIARFLAAGHRPPAARRLVAAAAVLLLLAGLPTTLIDAYNAQDLSNRAMGPGFHWTIAITPDEQAALAWIRRETPPDAVVAMDPTARGRETWSLIPSFAERRMPAGSPIALVNTPEAEARVALVQELYATTDARQAWSLARRLHIDYIYLDRTEREAYPAASIDKFAYAPEYFAPVFHNLEAAVFRVR